MQNAKQKKPNTFIEKAKSEIVSQQAFYQPPSSEG